MLIRTMLALLTCVSLSATLTADILNMKDGRRIEGEIIHQEAGLVTIDAMILDIRAKLTFDEDDIEKIVREDVASDFYQHKDIVPDKRLSDPENFSADDTLYLTIPVKGKIGVEFKANNLKRIIAYARRYRINNLVFEIDSSLGGNLDESSKIIRLLVKNQADFTYHAFITNCLGNALAVAIPCDHLILLPGSKIGGIKVPLRADKHPDSKMEYELLLRQQMGTEVEDYLIGRGRMGLIARAMIDPYYSLAIWRDKDTGTLLLSNKMPTTATPSKTIINTSPGEPLVLTAEQAYQLGAPEFKGTIKTYGKEHLKIDNWKKESDYAELVIKQQTDKAYARQATANMLFSNAVELNIEQREKAVKNLEHHLTNLIKWDPQIGGLARRNASWGWGQMPPSLRDEASNPSISAKFNTAKLSNHMLHVIRAIRVMKTLDQSAVKLNLKPSFQPGELDKLFKDIMARHEKLKAMRKKADN